MRENGCAGACKERERDWLIEYVLWLLELQEVKREYVCWNVVVEVTTREREGEISKESERCGIVTEM